MSMGEVMGFSASLSPRSVSPCRSQDYPADFLGVEVMAEVGRWETAGGPRRCQGAAQRP